MKFYTNYRIKLGSYYLVRLGISHYFITRILLLITYFENIVNIVILSPLHEVIEHENGLFKVEFSRTQESQIVVIVIHGMVDHAIVFKVGFELLESSLLLLTHVSHETKERFVSKLIK